MLQFAVTVRYTMEWTAILPVAARNDQMAEAQVARELLALNDLSTFEAWAAAQGSPITLQARILEVEDVTLRCH